ncbi:glycosyltransferase family 2 protein [Methanobacterium sp. SMA-27]|uniref:glycosyltransferase family 2 protein n=1 Tax=Methanobacterium sp. SMA-27 TaxID=1495336 RepID=UPI00064E1F13|nr:glycosyltransferase family 2 protein [Methanobacterium sp. SMA-27]
MNQKVSIIILNWNGWKDTIECLESLYQINYPNYNVILVDNGSQNKSIEMIKNYASGELSIESDFFEYKKFNKPIKILEFFGNELESLQIINENFNNSDSNNKLILIKNEVNSGFSEGNNLGINFSLQFLNTDYILLLNTDTVVDKNFLNELVKFADTNHKVGIVGPGVYHYNKPDKIDNIGYNVNICNARTSSPLDNLEEIPSSTISLDYVVGCGLLIKKSVIDDIGLLDKKYFLYYEDVDWCLRAKKQGYKVFYVPKARIWHKVSSLERKSISLYYYGNRNSFLLIKKNRDSIGILICYSQLLFNKFILALYLILKGQRKESLTVLKAINDGLRGNYGYKKLD